MPSKQPTRNSTVSRMRIESTDLWFVTAYIDVGRCRTWRGFLKAYRAELRRLNLFADPVGATTPLSDPSAHDIAVPHYVRPGKNMLFLHQHGNNTQVDHIRALLGPRCQGLLCLSPLRIPISPGGVTWPASAGETDQCELVLHSVNPHSDPMQLVPVSWAIRNAGKLAGSEPDRFPQALSGGRDRVSMHTLEQPLHQEDLLKIPLTWRAGEAAGVPTAAATSGAVSRELKVRNQYGVHARPAALIVKQAARFAADLWCERDGNRVSGKSIMGLMTLEACRGVMLTFTAEGDDAEQLLDELEGLFDCKFGED